MAGIKPLTPQCAKCGACTQVCPVFLETGRESLSPRGKLHLFHTKPAPASDYFNDLLSKCIQCGACDAICPRQIEPSQTIRAMRAGKTPGQSPKGYLTFTARKILNNRALLSATALTLPLLDKLPKASGLRHKIAFLNPGPEAAIPPPKKGATTTLFYYPGCLAKHFQTDIFKATTYLASLCGYRLTIPATATCCGLASQSSGQPQESQQQAIKNIRAYTGDGPILTSCGSCYAQLKQYPDLFTVGSDQHKQAVQFAERVEEFSSFFVKETGLAAHAPPRRVYYHDPCHLRFGPSTIITEPRQLIRNLNGAPVVNQDEPLGCCGQGGFFGQIHPLLAGSIFNRLHQKIKISRQTTLVTTCSSCLMGLQQGLQGEDVTILHLSVFLAKRCENC